MADMGMAVRRIKSVNKVQHAFGELRNYIVAGNLLPGTELPTERDMADQLGISKVCMREALSMAQTHGLIDVGRGRRTRVAAPSAAPVAQVMGSMLLRTDNKLLQLVEARQCLECRIAQLAATKAVQEDIDNLRETISCMESNSDNLDLCVEQDNEFHNILLKISGNMVFEIMLAPLAELLRESRRETQKFHGVPRAVAAHRKILAAIIAHDPDKAQEAMEAHLQGAEEDLKDRKKLKSE